MQQGLNASGRGSVRRESKSPRSSAAPSLDSLALRPRDRAWVEVDLGAIAHNVAQIQQWVGAQVGVMAVVKADGYGHGAIAVAEAALAAGARNLAVATIEEGGQLREAGIAAPIVVLGATQTAEQVKDLLRWRLQPTLCTAEQAALFSDALVSLGEGRPRPLTVHLNVDTGMSRLGTLWPEAAATVRLVHELPYLNLGSVYSHFATADENDAAGQATIARQHQRFEQVIAEIAAAGLPRPTLHMANSAGLLLDAQYHYDWVRPGLALYGLAPAPHLADRLSLRPALAVRARLTQLKTIAPGEGVSYGHHFQAQRPTQVAVVGIGYADGVPRNLSGRLEVLVRGQRLRQIGSITMDQLMLDATDCPDLRVGEVVTLLGEDRDPVTGVIDRLSANDWAAQLGTISWEILCGFKHRLPRLARPA